MQRPRGYLEATNPRELAVSSISDADLRQFLLPKDKRKASEGVSVDAQDMRVRAQRCRDLLRIAVRQEVRDQLREWAEEFDEAAEAMERERSEAKQRLR
jgi:hypothetical protein